MREAPKSLEEIKGRIQKICGIPVRVKVRRGRNRVEFFQGKVEDVYPKVFTVRKEGGEIGTFSYADVASGTILFSALERTQ